MTTLNMSLSTAAKTALESSSTVTLTAMYLSSASTCPTTVPTEGSDCLKDASPSGGSGKYMADFINNTSTDFVGKHLIISFINGGAETIFSSGSCSGSETMTVPANSFKNVEYAYNLEYAGQELWFNTSATWTQKIGTPNSHPAIGSATQPVYVSSDGSVTACNSLVSILSAHDANNLPAVGSLALYRVEGLDDNYDITYGMSLTATSTLKFFPAYLTYDPVSGQVTTRAVQGEGENLPTGSVIVALSLFLYGYGDETALILGIRTA